MECEMMCILFAAYDVHPDYRLIIAANRDEFYGRPTERAHFWDDEPTILAGRDLQKMGTWMGMTTRGRFAALTNYRDPVQDTRNKQSRGHIVRDFLTENSEPKDFLIDLQKQRTQYQGFNVLVADDQTLMYYSNVENKIKSLKPGLYGLSNHLLDTPWPKVEKGKAYMKHLLSTRKTIDKEDLFRILADEELVSKEQLPNTGVPIDLEEKLSAIFIQTPEYGTRCSTVITIDREGAVTFTERTFPNPQENEVSYEFRI